MKKNIRWLVVLSCCVGLFACQHKHEHAPTDEPIQIEIMSPKADSVYRSGSRIAIQAQLSFAYEMHGYHLRLTNETQRSLVIEIKRHTHNRHLRIDTAFTPTVLAETRYQLWLQGEKDHDGNVTEKSILFTVVP